MFKQFFITLIAAGTVLGIGGLTTVAAGAQDTQIGVTVNGSAVNISPAPIMQAGRVFVPLRGVFEQLGASVVYSNGTINATGNGRNISLQIGSTQATVNDQPQTIDVAPFIVGASTYVPLRFISEALGDSVNWDDADNIAAIDTGGGPADYFTPGTASYVDTAPPPIPVYEQPPVVDPNYVWQPGYWAWGSYGYYWVPGTWVQAPQPGYLWTPGYWQSQNNGYNWNPGYWAVAVGFYGGVNYGGGYSGRGYDGGQWSNNEFRYNTYVSHVNTTDIHNVYVNRNVYVDNSTTHVSYNGGNGGVQARPTAQQLAIVRGHHVGMTGVQQQHVQVAEQDRRLLATVNNNKPPVLAVARPLSVGRRPAGFVPVKPSDRVNPQANVAPVRVAPVHPARAGAHAVAPTAHVAPPAVHQPAAHVAPPVIHKPAAHVAPPVVHEPAAHVAPPVVHEPAAHVAPPVVHEPAAHVAPPVVHEPAAHVAPPVVHEPAAHVAPPARAPAVTEARPAPPVHVPAVHAAPLVHTAPVHEPAARAPAAHAAPPPHAPAAPHGPPRGDQKPPG
jgi:hypothetical protein